MQLRVDSKYPCYSYLSSVDAQNIQIFLFMD